MSSEGWDVKVVVEVEGAAATELIIGENSTCHGRPQRVIELIIGENSTCHGVIELIKCRPIWRPGPAG